MTLTSLVLLQPPFELTESDDQSGTLTARAVYRIRGTDTTPHRIYGSNTTPQRVNGTDATPHEVIV